MWTLAIKDIKLLLRDRAGAFFSIGFPLVYAIFFGLIFGGFGSDDGLARMPVAIVDLDRTEASTALAEQVAESSAIRVVEPGGDVDVDTDGGLAWVTERVRTGSIAAALVVPEGYGERSAMPFVEGPAELELLVDPSRQAERGLLQGVVLEAGYRQFQRSFSDPARFQQLADRGIEEIDGADAEERLRLAPLRFFLVALRTFGSTLAANSESDAEGDGAGSMLGDAMEGAFEPVTLSVNEVTAEGRDRTNAFAITFPQAILWGLMGTSFGFALSLVIERREGTLTRLRTAPVAGWVVIGGKALAAYLMMLAVTTLLLIVVRVAFGVVPTSVGLLAVSVAVTGFAFVGAMMLIASSGKTESQVSGVGWGTMIVLAMVGGAMVPRIAMPGWLQSVGWISPVRWAIDSIEGPLWRGLGVGELWLSWLLLVLLGAIGLVIGSRVFDRQSL